MYLRFPPLPRYIVVGLYLHCLHFLCWKYLYLSAYPSGKIALILDNSRIHHATELQPFLKKHPRMQLVFSPPYSPNLNPVEGL
ncbi:MULTISPECIES: transposase [Paenibacillus]|uniref:transposase n=1 Tax=Paenibacillus TaxID=44249 RepID=UPI001F2C3E1C|nr:transposase [Paenibacillus sp. JJ-223]